MSNEFDGEYTGTLFSPYPIEQWVNGPARILPVRFIGLRELASLRAFRTPSRRRMRINPPLPPNLLVELAPIPPPPPFQLTTTSSLSSFLVDFGPVATSFPALLPCPLYLSLCFASFFKSLSASVAYLTAILAFGSIPSASSNPTPATLKRQVPSQAPQSLFLHQKSHVISDVYPVCWKKVYRE